MRRLLILLSLLFIPVLSYGQESYTVNANANQVARLSKSIWRANAITCLNVNLPIGCTQAQACTAYNAVGGASCTAAQARAVNARLWLSTQAGREEFVIFFMLLPVFKGLATDDAGFDTRQFCVLWPLVTQAVRDNVCTDVGLFAGCELCVSTGP